MPPMAHFSNPSEDLTTMWCDTRRLTKLHFPSQHQLLNNTSTSPPTAIKFLLKWESRRMKTSTMANYDPRMNRTNPKYRALLGIIGTWSTSCDFCNYLLFALCVLDTCLQLLGVLLECVLLPCACACFWLLGLKTHWCVKEPWLGNLSILCVPPYLFMSARVA
jgi:hypothetical protein